MIIQFTLSMLISLSPHLLEQNRDFWHYQLESSSIDLRISALQKLGELRFIESLPYIIRSLSDSNSEVRFYAIKAMAKLPSEESKIELQTKFQVEKDPYLKSEIRRSIRVMDFKFRIF